MPTSRELVSNRALTGTELQRIILSDVSAMLEADGFLSQHIAYGRIAYEVRLVLHMDNPFMPSASNSVSSRSRTQKQVESDPALAAIADAPPLSPPLTEDATLHATERSRTIESPNLARIEHGLPVTVLHREQSGQTMEESIAYPKDIGVGEFIPPIDRDVTAEESDRHRGPILAAEVRVEDKVVDVIGDPNVIRRERG